MTTLESNHPARLREIIMERANRMSRQITEAAEEIGRRAAEERHQRGSSEVSAANQSTRNE